LVEYEEPGSLPAPQPDGPWGRGEQNESEGKPFLPDEPPVDLGGRQGGPWGPRRS
jgi:hypothetical protein